jgi:hypothetical protein
MKIKKNEFEFLIFYMEQTWTEMRHLEDLRERVTILVITLATGISGFIVQQGFSNESKYLIWLIVFLGLFGLFMTLKIFQIHQQGQKRLNKWYKYLEENCGDNPQILVLRDKADIENKKDFKIVSRIPHNYFWSTLFIIIIAGGLSLFLIKPQENSVENSLELNNPVKSLDNKNDTLLNQNSSINKSKILK